jgi:hypothetical protein
MILWPGGAENKIIIDRMKMNTPLFLKRKIRLKKYTKTSMIPI